MALNWKKKRKFDAGWLTIADSLLIRDKIISFWQCVRFVVFVQGVTAVHMAAQNGYTDVVSLLLSRSSGLLRIADKHGRTPLHLSAAHGHYDMSLLLIGQGADIDAYDKVTVYFSCELYVSK